MPHNFVAAGANVFFSATGDVGGSPHAQLWVTDGTSANTHLIADAGVSPNNESSVRPFAALGPNVLVQAKFTTNNGTMSALGSELYISDGVNLTLVKDLAPGSTDSGIAPGSSQVLTVGTKCYFTTILPGSVVELWVTDGVPLGAGTMKLATFTGQSGAFTPFGNSIVFTASDANGFHTFISDGTVSGTHLLSPALIGTATGVTVFNGKLYFAADGGGSVGTELWTSDGTALGTTLVKDINTNISAGSNPGDFKVLGTQLLFSAQTDAGRELWITDGTTNGTQLVKDIAPGAVNGLLGIGSSEFTIFNAVGPPNAAPTAVAINNGVVSVAENTSTAAHIKVGDIAVTDDGLGANALALTGADAAFFEIIGNELFLKAGTKLDFESGKTAYSVAVTVDDATVGGTPDATSTTFTLNIANVSPEIIIGTAAKDALTGGSDADWMFGLASNDVLKGLDGNDLLVGGRGRDIMTGGLGKDVFDFNAKAESGITASTRDKITDFKHLADHIDLKTIDANSIKPLDQAFKFIGTQAFHLAAGELHYFKVDVPGTAKDMTIIEGDTNGDGKADFQIELAGLVTLTKADFVL